MRPNYGEFQGTNECAWVVMGICDPLILGKNLHVLQKEPFRCDGWAAILGTYLGTYLFSTQWAKEAGLQL